MLLKSEVYCQLHNFCVKTDNNKSIWRDTIVVASSGSECSLPDFESWGVPFTSCEPEQVLQILYIFISQIPHLQKEIITSHGPCED